MSNESCEFDHLPLTIVGYCGEHELDWRHRLEHCRITVDHEGKAEYNEISGQIGVLVDLRVQNSTLARQNLSSILRSLADRIDADMEFYVD